MTRQSAASLRKLNSHLVHLAQEVEAKVNSSRKERELDLILDRQNQHVQTLEPSLAFVAESTKVQAQAVAKWH